MTLVLFQKPIISFGPTESDTKNLLSNFGKSFYHSYSDSLESVTKSIEILFKKEYNSQKYDTKKYNRSYLTKKLSDIINSL